MGLIIWMLFGGLVGWVAGELTGMQRGLVWDIIVGIVGAIIGGFFMSLVGKGSVNTFTLYGFLVALLGSCVLLGVVRVVRR